MHLFQFDNMRGHVVASFSSLPTSTSDTQVNLIDRHLSKTKLSPTFQKWFCIKGLSFPFCSCCRLPLILLSKERVDESAVELDPVIFLLHQPACHEPLNHLVCSFLKTTRVLLNLGVEHVNLTRIIIHVLKSLYCHLKVSLTQERPQYQVTTILQNVPCQLSLSIIQKCQSAEGEVQQSGVLEQGLVHPP